MFHILIDQKPKGFWSSLKTVVSEELTFGRVIFSWKGLVKVFMSHFRTYKIKKEKQAKNNYLCRHFSAFWRNVQANLLKEALYDVLIFAYYWAFTFGMCWNIFCLHFVAFTPYWGPGYETDQTFNRRELHSLLRANICLKERIVKC